MIERNIPQLGPAPKLPEAPQPRCQCVAAQQVRLTPVQPDGKLQKAIECLATAAAKNFQRQFTSASASDASEVEVLPVTPIKHVKRAMVCLGILLTLMATNT